MERILEPEVMDTPEEAESYDSMDHAEPNRAFIARLRELGAHGRMLDIGTGPGHIPLLICEQWPEAQVTAIDLAEHMLAHAERHRKASPHGDRVEFRKADAKSLLFDTDSFDVVYSNTILHHIPDPVPFLGEAARVLKPGGCLLIRDLYRPHCADRVNELVDLHAVGADAEQRELFRASLHAGLTPGELRVMADRVGLHDAQLVIDTDRHMSLQRAALSSI